MKILQSRKTLLISLLETSLIILIFSILNSNFTAVIIVSSGSVIAFRPHSFVAHLIVIKKHVGANQPILHLRNLISASDSKISIMR